MGGDSRRHAVIMKSPLYWIEGPWRGRVAIVPRPRGGDWLEDEVREWRRAGVNVIVSLLQPDEIAELDLALEDEICRANGAEYFSFSIMDRGVPESENLVAELVRHLERKLAQGQNVAVHCRQGVGRSALLAASVLAEGGIDSETALARVALARGCPVPDTEEQRQWITRFAGGRRAAISWK
jgi:protein-tyrosine phosphatase